MRGEGKPHRPIVWPGQKTAPTVTALPSPSSPPRLQASLHYQLQSEAAHNSEEAPGWRRCTHTTYTLPPPPPGSHNLQGGFPPSVLNCRVPDLTPPSLRLCIKKPSFAPAASPQCVCVCVCVCVSDSTAVDDGCRRRRGDVCVCAQPKATALPLSYIKPAK